MSEQNMDALISAVFIMLTTGGLIESLVLMNQLTHNKKHIISKWLELLVSVIICGVGIIGSRHFDSLQSTATKNQYIHQLHKQEASIKPFRIKGSLFTKSFSVKSHNGKTIYGESPYHVLRYKAHHYTSKIKNLNKYNEKTSYIDDRTSIIGDHYRHTEIITFTKK